MFADVEKCLDSMLSNLDPAVSKAITGVFDLTRLVEDLLARLQRRLEMLRVKYSELSGLFEHTQAYEVVVQGLVKTGTGGELEVDLAFDDVMQYFDFLDEAESGGEKSRTQAVRDIELSQLPSDFNHFLIRHFSHCIQLLDVSGLARFGGVVLVWSVIDKCGFFHIFKKRKKISMLLIRLDKFRTS